MFLQNEVADRNGFSWRQIIRSGKKLREKFNDVLLKSRSVTQGSKENQSRNVLESVLNEIQEEG